MIFSQLNVAERGREGGGGAGAGKCQVNVDNLVKFCMRIISLKSVNSHALWIKNR